MNSRLRIQLSKVVDLWHSTCFIVVLSLFFKTFYSTITLAQLPTPLQDARMSLTKLMALLTPNFFARMVGNAGE